MEFEMRARCVRMDGGKKVIQSPVSKKTEEKKDLKHITWNNIMKR